MLCFEDVPLNCCHSGITTAQLGDNDDDIQASVTSFDHVSVRKRIRGSFCEDVTDCSTARWQSRS
jgi:hypothetical protein